jgi:3-oxoacyl-[acyl-carrier-protein] synthase-3
MNVMNDACITATGAFLPGDPVDNEQLAARLGAETRRSAALRRRTLAANGIKTRHYAVDDAGLTLMLNEELAAEAARRALNDRGLGPAQVSMLATGTTQGDLLVPGFASMMHGRLGGGPMELLSAAGVCASGMAALKAVVSAVRLGEHPVAVAVGSELVQNHVRNTLGKLQLHNRVELVRYAIEHGLAGELESNEDLHVDAAVATVPQAKGAGNVGNRCGHRWLTEL